MAGSNTHSIFVSTSCLPGVEPIDSRLSLYLSHGLNAIELAAGVSVEKNSLSNIAGIECNILVHNYFPKPPEHFVLNLASQNQRLLELSMSLCERAIDLAAILKAPFYSVHAGFRANLTPESLGKPLEYERTFPYDVAYHTFVRSIRQLAAFGRSRGVGILVELNVLPRFNLVQGRNELALICEGGEVTNLIRDVDDPGLGILLDTGHLNVTSHTLGFDRMAFVDQVAPHIRAFHVHDNDRTADTHQPVQPGSWVFDVLSRPEFADLPIVVEAKLANVAELRRHVDWMQEQLGRQ